MSLKTPKPPAGSYDAAAAGRGRALFRTDAGCASCHRSPTLSDVFDGPDASTPLLHSPESVGQDPRYAERSATREYRRTPLRGLQQHPPYFHDGSAPTLRAVVEHYDAHFALGLSDEEKSELVEYLKSL